MFSSILRFFDRFEDKNRHFLSRYPTLYALIGGTAIVLFWRGVWMLADMASFMTPITSIVISKRR